MGLTPGSRLRLSDRASGTAKRGETGSDVIQIVRSWADDQDSDVPARHVLLIPNVLIYCDEDVKVLFSQGQQLPILLAAESCVSNGLTFMTANLLAKFCVFPHGSQLSCANCVPQCTSRFGVPCPPYTPLCSALAQHPPSPETAPQTSPNASVGHADGAKALYGTTQLWDRGFEILMSKNGSCHAESVRRLPNPMSLLIYAAELCCLWIRATYCYRRHTIGEWSRHTVLRFDGQFSSLVEISPLISDADRELVSL